MNENSWASAILAEPSCAVEDNKLLGAERVKVKGHDTDPLPATVGLNLFVLALLYPTVRTMCIMLWMSAIKLNKRLLSYLLGISSGSW